MLLPETFADFDARHYLLAVRDQAPHIVAAASFRACEAAISHLRLHVLPPFRRQKIGTRIIEHLARRGSLEGISEITREPAALPFCERNAFRRLDALTTVEAEIAAMREYAGRLRARLPLPPGAAIIPLSDAPKDQVAGLHALHVAHDDLNPWRARVAESKAMHHSPVAMLDGRVAGMLLWELKGATAVVASRVVDPVHQGGWVNAVLLAEGLDGAWNGGARRVRFSYTDSNRDTRKLARRFQAETVSTVVQFRKCMPLPADSL